MERTATDAARPPELVPGATLAPLTTIRVGGPADWLCTARSFRESVAALAWARANGVPVAVVGRGSNLLVADEGFRGLVLRLAGRLTAILPRVRPLHDFFRLIFRSDDPRRSLYQAVATTMAAQPLR